MEIQFINIFKKTLPLLLLLLLSDYLFAQDNYWQQQVNFKIDVALNDQRHSLDGVEKIEYINNSPDTLFFIWFHIWPNAFKNDKTAFSDQLLLNGRTDFYFSSREQRGYINRLDFKVNGITATMEDHPQYIDVIKIILPKPLPPSSSVSITTPFHVKLPYNFSRGGHTGQSYQVTQWFPKPAVYDRKGWHPMPYLDQGEFYSEFGNYDVTINLPSNYVVAATGELQNEDEKQWLKTRSQVIHGETALEDKTSIAKAKTKTTAVKSKSSRQQVKIDSFPSSSTIKSVRFVQNNVHDFAWFADKRFIVSHDSLQMRSGRIIDLYSFYLSGSVSWQKSMDYIKDAVRKRSEWIGEYPYNIVSVVEAQMGVYGGMEYPTITSVSPINSDQELDVIIQHEIGHNWFYGVIANNERLHPWLDEGINTYYYERYEAEKYNGETSVELKSGSFASRHLPSKAEALAFETLAAMGKDQPINTSSEKFSEANYGVVTYYKTSLWLKNLESYLGQALFDSCLSSYYQSWKFRHPYPEDFKRSLELTSGKNLDSIFLQLNNKGSLTRPVKKSIQPTFFFNIKNTDKKNYISFAPVPGYNDYDGIMAGLAIHNYQLPFPRLQFIAIPMYGTRTNTFNGIGRAAYNWYPQQAMQHIEVGLAASTFTINRFEGVPGNIFNLKYTKIAPFLRATFNENILSKRRNWVQLKWYMIGEDELDFRTVISGPDTSDVIDVVKMSTHMAELKYVIENTRELYPYKAELQLQQHKDFLRATVTANYFFNYSSNKGGMKLRFFAGKFIYTGNKTSEKQFQTDRYHLNLTGAKGDEDYTYSNYFVGRNRFEKWPSQQIMIRDGGFKVRADLLSDKPGKTDDWLTAANLTATIPDHLNPLQVLPFRIPLRLFFDIGTYSEPWKTKSQEGKFLYDAGFQLSFLKETINIYIPVMYSSIYRDYFRSTLGTNRLLKTISFSIDIQDLTSRKINKDFNF